MQFVKLSPKKICATSHIDGLVGMSVFWNSTPGKWCKPAACSYLMYCISPLHMQDAGVRYELIRVSWWKCFLNNHINVIWSLADGPKTEACQDSQLCWTTHTIHTQEKIGYVGKVLLYDILSLKNPLKLCICDHMHVEVCWVERKSAEDNQSVLAETSSTK